VRCVGPRGAAGVTSRVSMGNQREVLFRARDGPRGFVTYSAYRSGERVMGELSGESVSCPYVDW